MTPVASSAGNEDLSLSLCYQRRSDGLAGRDYERHQPDKMTLVAVRRSRASSMIRYYTRIFGAQVANSDGLIPGLCNLKSSSCDDNDDNPDERQRAAVIDPLGLADHEARGRPGDVT
jgi:hypothetical protein